MEILNWMGEHPVLTVILLFIPCWTIHDSIVAWRHSGCACKREGTTKP